MFSTAKNKSKRLCPTARLIDRMNEMTQLGLSGLSEAVLDRAKWGRMDMRVNTRWLHMTETLVYVYKVHFPSLFTCCKECPGRGRRSWGQEAAAPSRLADMWRRVLLTRLMVLNCSIWCLEQEHTTAPSGE